MCQRTDFCGKTPTQICISNQFPDGRKGSHPIDFNPCGKCGFISRLCILELSMWGDPEGKKWGIQRGLGWLRFGLLGWESIKSCVQKLAAKRGKSDRSNHGDSKILIYWAKKVHRCIIQKSRWLISRLQQYVNRELPDVQTGFRKVRGTRDHIAIICWIIKKAREFQKNIYFCFIDDAKAFDCVDHNKLENSSRDGNTRPPDLTLENSVCRSGSNS